MKDKATMKDIGLLLAHAESGAAILAEGLDWETAVPASAPKQKPVAADDYLRSDGGDPGNLREQRWGLVVPRGPEGKRLREIIAPLTRLREEQQGSKAIVYEVEPGMTTEQTWDWWADVYKNDTHDGKRITERERPRYLLALGGPEQISWDFQTTAGNDLFLGRLAFQADGDYEAYVEKVLRHEGTRPTTAARALFHTVRDGTKATTLGYDDLMRPALEAAREGADDGGFATQNILVLGQESQGVSLTSFLEAAAAPTPTMLFTISHGSGAPRQGWKSVEEQQRFQGAMQFTAGQQLSYEGVEKGSFLPGGVWFFVACLSAGTPSTSEYYHWLKRLQEMGSYRRSIDNVLDSLPKRGEVPFVARLPQAALANPDGPISVVGHVDLAWTFSFCEERMDARGELEIVSRSSRFDDVFRQMVAGTRVGASCNSLNTVFNNANGELTSIFNQAEKYAVKGVAPAENPAKKRRMAKLWLTRQDLAAYVTLGDPAAHLNVIDASPRV